VRVLSAILRKGEALDDLLAGEGGHLASLVRHDRALARAIVATALRRKGQIDDLLSRYLERPLPEKSGAAYEILLSGLTQILFLDTQAHAAVDLSVTLAKYDRRAKPLAGLVNAVLRRAVRDGAKAIAGQDEARLNTPRWLMARWEKAYGPETARAIAAAHLEVPPLDISCKSDPDVWAEKLGGTLMPTGTVRLANAGSVANLAGYDEGAWWVQDAAAALPAQVLGDVAGKRVLDLCAAPGGKTAQLAAAGANVTALDRSAQRLQRLTDNLKRLSLSVESVRADALDYTPDQPFEAVLLDAPCSATGTIRRHPDIARLKSEETIAVMAELQARLLTKALTLTAAGGTLVYCTCSLEPEEGEEIIAGALAADGDISRMPIEPSEVAGESAFITESGDLRTLPCHWQHFDAGLRGLDGFHVSRLKRG